MIRKSHAEISTCDDAASHQAFGTRHEPFEGYEGLLRGYEGVLRGLLRGRNLKPYNGYNPFEGFEGIFR